MNAPFSWLNEPDKTTPLNKANLEAMQTAMLDTVYPVGSLFRTKSDEDYSNYLGATWVKRKCSELIDSGISKEVNFRIYSDGYCEMWYQSAEHNIENNSANVITFGLPFSYVGDYGIDCTMRYGTAYWSWVSHFAHADSANTISISEFNDGEATARAIAYYWKTYGYIEVTNPIYLWERVS